MPFCDPTITSSAIVASYSPECVEGEFREVRPEGVLGSWKTIARYLHEAFVTPKLQV
jgi:hypothetical protein